MLYDGLTYTSSAELCEKMSAECDTAILAFSTGKDSLAAWLQMRKYFKRIVPYYCYCVPGISFVEDSLRYYEDFFGCHIYRLPHRSFFRFLRYGLFQPPYRIPVIEGADLADDMTYNDDVIGDIVRNCARLPDGAYVGTGVLVGLFSSVALIVATKIALLYTPVEYDYANPSMQVLFGLNLRITASSIVMYLIANMADIAVFDKLKEMTGGKWLWMRNNTATILCNCLENFGFIFLAFLGVYSAAQCVEIALATSIIEIVAAVCDTPFAYIGRKIEPMNRG